MLNAVKHLSPPIITHDLVAKISTVGFHFCYLLAFFSPMNSSMGDVERGAILGGRAGFQSRHQN